MNTFELLATIILVSLFVGLVVVVDRLFTFIGSKIFKKKGDSDDK